MSGFQPSSVPALRQTAQNALQANLGRLPACLARAPVSALRSRESFGSATARPNLADGLSGSVPRFRVCQHSCLAVPRSLERCPGFPP